MVIFAHLKSYPNSVMKHYNFDEIIDRRGTNCVKVDKLPDYFGQADLLPLWVADMDFRTPDFVVEAIKKRCEHEVFGYTFPADEYYESIINWVNYKHQWKIQKEWLCYIPGIVKGIAFALQCFTAEGDKVIIQPPVYHPFRHVIESNGRKVVNNHLRVDCKGKMTMDLELLERQLTQEQCSMMILCNPHNPGGVIWDKHTLMAVAEICKQHGVVVCSDEIHGDLGLFGNRYNPFATVSEAARDISVTFGAPSKTFNIPGIVSSWVVVKNPMMRRKFYTWLSANELNEPTFFQTVATEAAYRHGEQWLEAVLAYIEANIRFVESFIGETIPEIKVIRPEASYLVWLDCSSLCANREQLDNIFVKHAHLALNPGEMFGDGGEMHMRLNVGCPRTTLAKALELLAHAVKEMKENK